MRIGLKYSIRLTGWHRVWKEGSISSFYSSFFLSLRGWQIYRTDRLDDAAAAIHRAAIRQTLYKQFLVAPTQYDPIQQHRLQLTFHDWINRPSANRYQNSPNAFNNYFLSIANKIICDTRQKNSKDSKSYESPTHNLTNLFHKPFPNIQFNNTTTNEINKIIKSLNLKKILWLWRDFYKNNEDKCTFYLFSSKLYLQ